MARTSRLNIRLTHGEQAHIETRSAACGMAPSTYVREVALLCDTPPVRVADADELRRIHVDLKRIGNNLYGADEQTLGMLRDALGPVSEAAASLATLLAKENDYEP